jgi:hypothetical protein
MGGNICCCYLSVIQQFTLTNDLLYVQIFVRAHVGPFILDFVLGTLEQAFALRTPEVPYPKSSCGSITGVVLGCHFHKLFYMKQVYCRSIYMLLGGWVEKLIS